MRIYFCAGLMIALVLQTGCLSEVWTGANLVYNRHGIYKTLSDFQIAVNANQALFKDKLFKCKKCSIDLAVFNGDILLAGHVPTKALRDEAIRRVKKLSGYRRFFSQVSTRPVQANTMLDNWITTKIRSEILSDSDIDPHGFKVVTSDQIVYLMGDVVPKEAQKVIRIARSCDGVRRVVKILKYYNLSDTPKE